MSNIYLDNSATTPVSKRALEAMLPYFREDYGNPSAVYGLGQSAHNALEKCRNRVARCIGALPTEIYFTSGGTESDNWAIRGICRDKAGNGRHIITSAIEHNAVLRTLAQLEEDGFEVTYLRPDSFGRISPEQLEDAIRPDTILISVMLANNVVGTILDIKELAKVARRHNIVFHTDAVQAVGHIPVNVRKLGIDLLSCSAHKFGGPKGVGFLFCRLPLRPSSLFTGGGQEKSLRSGTENIPGIVGLTTALEEAVGNMEEEMTRLTALREKVIAELTSVEGVELTGHPEERLPGFCSFTVSGITHSVLLVNKLNEYGVCVSSGSACSASSKEASHVLMALGMDKHRAATALRISIGSENDEAQVLRATELCRRAIAEVRGDESAKAPRLEGRVTEIGGKKEST